MPRFPRLFGKRTDDLDCKDVRSLASDVLDEEVDEAVLARVQRHLAWCGPCQAFAATLAKTVGLLRGLPQESAPPGIKASIIAETKEKSEEP